MIILPLADEIIKYANDHHLGAKFKKQCRLFVVNQFHPSLNVELLEPRAYRIWSFRIDKKYRALFIYYDSQTVEILKITKHYR